MTKASDRNHVLILGAGASGVAAAFELARTGVSVSLIEKTKQVGGLSKTLEFATPEGVYRTDIGPHRFFSNNAYLYQLIGSLLKDRWAPVPRHTDFFVGGKYYTYPIQIGNVLQTLNKGAIPGMLLDYSMERVRALIRPRPIRSFEDYALSTFGRSLARFNILNYTEKIWGIPCHEISIDWASQRISGLNPLSAVLNVLCRQRKARSLVDTFYYPTGGTGLIYETMVSEVERYGGNVCTQSTPVNFHVQGNRVTSVTLRTPEGVSTVSPDSVVSSIPITECVHLFGDAAPPEVKEASKKLKFRSQAYLFLTLDKERATKDNWIYFPDKEVPFGRIAEMKNFSSVMCPPGKTSLFIEFFCFENDEVWHMSKDELLAATLPWLQRLGIASPSEVTSVHHLRESYVYPLYDLSYREYVSLILSWMDSLENFYAIGRPGRFRYTNQDHSLEMGILAARSIVEGRRYDIDQVAQSREYFERGFVPDLPSMDPVLADIGQA